MGDIKTLLLQQIDATRIVERTLENFKKLGKAKLTVATVQNRITRLNDAFTECQNLHKQITAAATEAERCSSSYFTQDRFLAVHEIFLDTSDYMAETLSRLTTTSSSDNTLPTAGSDSQYYDVTNRLPTLELPQFSGAFIEWETFRDKFKSMIIARKGLSNVSRFQYLLSCLKGEASELVDNIAITDAGYTIAWDMLVATYDNKRMLVATHLETLYDLPHVRSESVDQLRKLRDKTNKTRKALLNLERPVEHWDDILVFLVTKKLDHESRKAWELVLGKRTDCPTFCALDEFLQSRICALQTIKPVTTDSASRIAESVKSKASRSRATSLHGAAAAKSPCALCNANHTLGQCASFKSKSVSQRFEYAKGTNRCINCLSSRHPTKKCTSAYNCSICKKRHHTLLHFNESTASSHNSATPTDNDDSLVTSQHASCSVPRIIAIKQVMLATAWVELRSPSGRSERIRALIDQGSVISLISENLTQRLRLPRSRVSVSITGIGNNTVACRSSTTFTVASCKTESVYSMTAYVLGSLSHYVPPRVTTDVRLSHVRDLELADDRPFDSAPIELIIGADQYGLLLLDGLRKGTVNDPTAQNTTLGWILSGPVSSSMSNSSPSVASFHCHVSLNLDEELRRFWEVEELPFVMRLSPAEQKCEEHFQRTHTRAPNGQYIVRLPFIEGPPIDIGSSLPAAKTMFLRQEKRLQRNAQQSEEYSQFLREYEALGHMNEVSDQSLLTVPSLQSVYIPHHAIVREHSATTRLRVVFNASARTGNGTSLNDHLLIGPKLQTDLAAVILRWRRCRYVFIADIAKMYRQILVDPKDVDYQRVLWRSSPSEPLRHFQLLTVTYGTGPAPYLALRVLQQLAKDEGSKYPLAQLVLRDQIYVDDCVFGADNPQLARQIRDDVISLLTAGGFKLRKWASNSPELIADIDPSDHGFAASKPLLPDDNLKVLGINWNPEKDSFRFDIGMKTAIPATKRAILSTIARFYDPLGWAASVVVAAKILMQRLWLQKCGWDDTIPNELREVWTTYCTQLPLLRSVVLPRWTGYGLHVQKTELHGFADASQHAYAAVVYSRVTTDQGDILVSLLAAKSKVSPLKSLTIPRLELCGALLLARLMFFIRASFGDCACEMHGWTDSTVTLAWISQSASRWKTFVANRVATIQELVPTCQWHHVQSEDNPADCASRGINVSQLVTHSLWWHGPKWLKSPSTLWPCEAPSLEATTSLEERVPTTLHTVPSPKPWDLATRFSSWPKLIRVTAYILRFIAKLRSPITQSRSPSSVVYGSSDINLTPRALLTTEVRRARTYWLKIIQRTVHPAEVQHLHAKLPLPRHSPLISLNPYLDSEGLIRVGGRLRNAAMPEQTRHPILLASHPLVLLLIRHLHLSLLHAGPQLTLAKLRQEFWLLRARPIVRQVLYKCIVCTRQSAKIPSELMGDLPSVRVTRAERAFLHCGVDYAGPIPIRTTPGRGHKSVKAYIALFICMTTRAVHIELVGSCTTQAFLACYNRFSSRRGLPVAMYSDNGTTFQGADKEVTAAFRAATRDANVLNKLASDQVAWHFIPPSAPHFGGLWEAGIRSMKHHLKRVIGSHTFTFEELTTVLCGIEACMNSRPIAPCSENIDDYTALTPGHFLIGTAITTIPAETLLDVHDSRLTRWQLLKKLSESIWKSWSNNYLHSLQQRAKWRTASRLATVGRLVLLRNALAPPCKWELARIVKCHPGVDNLTRVVTIKTANSEYKRPIVKLCFLPVDLNDSETCTGKNADDT